MANMHSYVHFEGEGRIESRADLRTDSDGQYAVVALLAGGDGVTLFGKPEQVADALSDALTRVQSLIDAREED